MGSKVSQFTKSLGVLALTLVAAVLFRRYLLQPLGTKVVWVTFYPAVMLTALYGGWIPGILCALISVLIALFGWSWIGPSPFLVDQSDTLATAVYLLICLMIALVADLARRSRRRAIEARRAAESANQAKSTFLAHMSHELRSPLNAILGFTNLLLEDQTLTLDQRRSLEIVGRSGNTLLTLINEVLDLAKVEAGKVRLDESVFNLRELLADIQAQSLPGARAKDLTLDLEWDESSEEYLLADGVKLRQAVLNLVTNALKFTAHGGVTIRGCASSPSDPPWLRVVIEVEDTGIGIAPGDQERIFESFVQVGPPTDQPGTGLGLAITRQFVNLMGGRMEVESTPGTGSLFRIQIPARRASSDGRVTVTRPQGVLGKLEPDQPPVRVLVVEDQVENQVFMQQVLGPAGFQVRIAGNGEEGVSLFQTWNPHFIWLDRKMPVCDGLEALRRIRSLDNGKAVKFVMLSASTFREERALVLSSGADGFLSKPASPQEIYQVMARHLGIRFQVLDAEQTPKLPDLSVLDPGLRRDLTAALVSLDPVRIASTVKVIEDQYPPVGRALRLHVDRLQYTMILRALPQETA